MAGAYEKAEAPMPMEDVEAEMAYEPSTVADTNYQSVERIVIKNADLSIVVDDPSASTQAIITMAEGMGGFVVSANIYQTTLESGASVPEGSITVRVPAERLNEALAQIRELSDQDPLSESLGSQDVTRDYVDLQSRLRNLESAEAQLANIMDAAVKTEDVLSVYNELLRIREEIEVIKGQIQYYEEAAALSAISVQLRANEAVQPLTIGSWQPSGVAKSAIQALINTLKFVANAVIWIVLYILPVLTVLFIVFILPPLLVLRAWRRRRATKKAQQAEQQAKAPPAPPT
jgi:hypothetical protein